MARIDLLVVLLPTREEIQVEREKLDCDIGRAMTIREKAVRKPMGK